MRARKMGREGGRAGEGEEGVSLKNGWGRRKS